ncbi:MAG: DUF512 domain-containing protein [Oscillospiraceae bacterium]|jgi:putative radical SAM enzyme (TIGR03279 family)|nr:DUF512 domain-containing protein [Oscillospiraceae bacterium]
MPIITGITPGSPAARRGIAPGDDLLRINGHEIRDFLDYRFHAAESLLRLEIRKPGGKTVRARIRKGEYEDLGLEFANFLMDEQRRCRNHCIFCFIDQLPPGLRESLYFKDDDARLSFLFGNYITLTNLDEQDAERMIAMRISPIRVSVHTMDPALRAKMMGNPRAGESLRLLERFAAAGLEIDAQLVLCPGWNDGPALEDSLRRLLALPSLRSAAAVPVGLTRCREGLPPLRGFSPEEAAAVIDTFGVLRQACAGLDDPPELCPSDEFFLLAGRDLPEPAYYGAFRQLENGVGMWSLLRGEALALLADPDWLAAARAEVPADTRRRATLVTGTAAAPLLRLLADELEKSWHAIRITVVPVVNRFFGETITVAGLLTGQDIAARVCPAEPRGDGRRREEPRELGDEVLLPACCFRSEGDLTLDGWTLDRLRGVLGIPVRLVGNDAEALLRALLGV